MFPRARKIVTIGGIDLRLDRSWIVIAFLIVLSFQSRWTADFGTTTAVVMALAAAVLFFASLLLHEFGHAAEARHRDIEVGGITLFLLGGVTEMRSDARRPRDEFAIAAIGPFLSLVAGAAFGLLATTFDLLWNVPAAEHVLGLLGWLNVGLALFNMLPASPLDGGRVLRAGIWALTGDRRRAVVLSARAGQVLAIGVLALAVDGLFAGNLTAALVNVLVAWFLWAAAQSELRHTALDRLLEGRHAGALALEPGASLAADTSLAVVAAGLDADTARGARTVHDDDGVVGALVLRDVLGVHPQDRVFRVVGDVMRPATALPRIASDATMWSLLETFQREPLVLLDLDDGTTTSVTARQFAEALEGLTRRSGGRGRRTSVTGVSR